MPEIQSSPQTNGASTQRFIEFVMMQAQQAAFCLGKIPNPSTGETMINLEGARMFIDYLELLQEKTQGNLSKEEEGILGKVLADLQLTFVHVSQENQKASTSLKEEEASSALSQEGATGSDSETEEDHHKKFSKSYGA